MMSGGFVVIMSLEQSTMASTWTEYLCVRVLAGGRARLEVCQYEALAENSFFDDDGNPTQLPTHIDGKEVVGIEDDYVVGGELTCHDIEDPELALEFGRQDQDLVNDWLNAHHFNLTERELRSLWAVIS